MLFVTRLSYRLRKIIYYHYSTTFPSNKLHLTPPVPKFLTKNSCADGKLLRLNTCVVLPGVFDFTSNIQPAIPLKSLGKSVNRFDSSVRDIEI